MTTRYYRWNDSGAPALSSAIDSLIGLLDACLVTGYGAKDPLGWGKPFTGTNIAVFRPGAGNRHYLRVLDDSTATTGARLVGYETMSGASTGTGPFPTEAQLAGGLWFGKSDTTGAGDREWFLIGDEKRFYLIVGRTTGGIASTASNSISSMFFGDVDSVVPSDGFHTMITSKWSTNTNVWGSVGTLAAGRTVAQSGHYFCRAANQTTASAAATKLAEFYSYSAVTPPCMGADGPAFPDASTGGMLLARVLLTDTATGQPRGYLPGIYNPLHAYPGAGLDTFAGKAGTPLAGKSFILMEAGATNGPAVTNWRRSQAVFDLSDWE